MELALYAEHDYLEMNVGKMDQSCEVYSKKDHLLFLDTLTDEYKLIPQSEKMPPYAFAVIFSGKERKLANTAFNSRVGRGKGGVLWRCARLQAFLTAVLRTVICVMCPKRSLMNIKARSPRHGAGRAEHFYGEFSRVQRGAKAWENGDIAEFGRIMFESGHSSIYNWETGSPELKTLYEIMLKCDGIYGGRFSGAGFQRLLRCAG